MLQNFLSRLVLFYFIFFVSYTWLSPSFCSDLLYKYIKVWSAVVSSKICDKITVLSFYLLAKILSYIDNSNRNYWRLIFLFCNLTFCFTNPTLKKNKNHYFKYSRCSYSTPNCMSSEDTRPMNCLILSELVGSSFLYHILGNKST